MSNPLLQTSRLPDFTAILPEHAEPAIRARVAANRERLQALLSSDAASFAAVVEPVEEMSHLLSRTWSPVGHLNSVMSSPALRDAYTTCLSLLTEYQTELGQNEDLYRRYTAIAEREGPKLDATQRRLLDNALRDFRLAGVALDAQRKDRFKILMQELAQLQAKFQENVLDSAKAWSRRIADVAELAGLPQPVIERARALAREQNFDGWLLTLDMPTYSAVITHAQSRALRQELYTAWNTRASDQGPVSGWDNSPLIEDILRRRHELAQLLGFPHYAGLSLATKMARSAEEVATFLEDLAARCLPVAQRELAELERYAGSRLEPWDVAFHSERLRRERFDVSDEELRPYFPLPQVLDGLFAVTSRLYGVQFRARQDVAVWEEHVRFFDILRDGAPIGGFYLDPYARPNKRSGAWMDDCVGRLDLGSQRALPIAYLTCNFLPPAGAAPSGLTHTEVITLFHEFGHGLHHMMTRIGYPSVAGINGVAWDAVELPSQFMENFAWNADVLALISRHVQTGQPLPRDKMDRLNGARTFHAGMAAVRQLEFALIDMKLHSDYDPAQGSRWPELLAAVRSRVAVVHPPAFNRYLHSFTHIFAGGYAAGYYSYKWAEVLAADAFAAFEEEGIFNPDTARRFLDAILSRGGSRDALETFVDFRGRSPRIEPLLRQLGMEAT